MSSLLWMSEYCRRSSLVAAPKIIHRMIFACLLRFVGLLPPVLISRYAKNHSPDDFCLRHYAFYINLSLLLTPYSCLNANRRNTAKAEIWRSLYNPRHAVSSDIMHYAFYILHYVFCINLSLFPVLCAMYPMSSTISIVV